jgi:hypothetical protein
MENTITEMLNSTLISITANRLLKAGYKVISTYDQVDNVCWLECIAPTGTTYTLMFDDTGNNIIEVLV